jgi:hypothetical protein
MKKLLLSLTTLLLMSCGTPVINQVEVYGEVEDVYYYNNHYRMKVWCSSKGKYYKIISDRAYQIGERIRIK